MAKQHGARSKLKIVSARAKAHKGHRRSTSNHMVQRARKLHKQTGIEAIVEGWLAEAGIPYEPEFAISRTHVDFFLPPSTVIEVQGCFWHGCQQCTETYSKRQLRARARDSRRFLFLKNAGYNLILLWEHDIVNHPEAAKAKLFQYSKAA